jgi:hypothetical protein
MVRFQQLTDELGDVLTTFLGLHSCTNNQEPPVVLKHLSHFTHMPFRTSLELPYLLNVSAS